MVFQLSGCSISQQYALRFWIASLVCSCFAGNSLYGGEWEQWRGTSRNGADFTTVSLLDALPSEGLKPVWVNSEDVKNGGGWSSPIVANGCVLEYFHGEKRRENIDAPEVKFPKLSEEEQAKLSPEEFNNYEEKRQAESVERREKLYTFFDQINCLNVADGSQKWSFERDSEQTRWRQSSTPAVSVDTLYFVSADRHLVSLDTQQGEQIWAVPLPVDHEDISPISSSPLIVGNEVFVLAERLISFSRKDGEVLWQSELAQDGAIYSSPVAYTTEGESILIANMGQHGTVGFDSKTGETLWNVESYPGRSTPVIQADRLITYGASRKGGVRCYDLKTDPPKTLWEYHRVSDQGSSPVVAGDRVFVQGETQYACLDLQTGKEIWRTELNLDRPRYTSPIAVADQVLYTFEGVLCVSNHSDEFAPLYEAGFNREYHMKPKTQLEQDLGIESLRAESDGEIKANEVWKKEVTSQGPRTCTSPAWSNGKLILRLNDGIACYDLVNSH